MPALKRNDFLFNELKYWLSPDELARLKQRAFRELNRLSKIPLRNSQQEFQREQALSKLVRQHLMQPLIGVKADVRMCLNRIVCTKIDRQFDKLQSLLFPPVYPVVSSRVPSRRHHQSLSGECA